MSPVGRNKRQGEPGRSRPGRSTERGWARRPAAPTRVYVFSREGIRALDEAAARELGIPTILLMEHASLAVARHATEILGSRPGAKVLIYCGKGNKAGDGLALARHLHLRGNMVRVVLAGDGSGLPEDAAANLAMARRLDIPITSV